ncbi:MFS transporter [Conexibacter sp. JD483]|uniref:MFS transporter n=1 Tax=unclassified Conexibacter TaxID=2627773 RepID=UPI00271B2AE4|nr:MULTISPECIES: MFS transporter [unclassified Conexibacter]MDO8184090.1 MFS transporter [Conexibacter sp. CPCC 205706]MDO8197082.1 MFS transporter [Conexibacter sp. CPCC 205762]MDR9371121.1 MFS transporter [Conexibacter sp. JD483]
MSGALRRSFSSLRIPNYRRYFLGQVVSVSGTWVQTVAETWLVLKLTGSGFAVGVAAALQFAPMLLAGAWGGAIADRLPKRRLLTFTQLAMALPALTLFGLTASGAITLWALYLLIFARGLVLAIDNPARQSFLVELVGPERVLNAVSLNSALINSARIIGPAIAGVLITTVGVAPCFAVNAVSFLAMIVALQRMDRAQLTATPVTERAPGQVRSALRYVRATPELWIPLALTAVVGTFTFNFQILLPLLADFTFHGDAGVYATLTTAMGVGAIAGAIANGSRARVRPSLLVSAALAFGALVLALSSAPTELLAVVALVPVGAASVAFSASVNSALQLAVAPAMRGRVMALYSVVFLGSTPIGAPLMGWLANAAGPRAAFALGGLVAIAAGLAARAAFARAGVPAQVPLGRPEHVAA